jgi:transcription antitermination factor NusG
VLFEANVTLFRRLDPQSELPVVTTVGVIQIVGIGKTPVADPDGQVATLRTVVESRLPVPPWPFLQGGQRVCIEAGPLGGLEGILLCYKNHYRLAVSATLLHRSVAVEVGRDWVTPSKPGVCSAWTESSLQRMMEISR